MPWTPEHGLAGRRFRRIAAAGIFFQGGAAAVDTSTIVAALVNGLTGSAYAVGAAAAIARYGWLFPQLFVGYFAQHRRRRLPFYMVGAFGRVACLAAVAGLIAAAGAAPGPLVVAMFFVLWTVYALVSGIVAVPYNDIVARAVASERRSRLLAVRFFGGGLLALGVAAAAHRLLDTVPFPGGFAAVLGLGAGLLLVSTLAFVSAGEPQAPPVPDRADGFVRFLRGGVEVMRGDRRFRMFLYSQWLGGAAAMALPFYIVQAAPPGALASHVAVLLGAQTAGALASNPLWGWWGDRRGKRSLLEATAGLGVLAPLLTLAWMAADGAWPDAMLPWFAVVFALIGAAGNGGTIAQLGYLMEISPDDRRPAYSGYFNALAAPAALLPLAGAAIAEAASYEAVFAASLGAAVLQVLAVRRLRPAVGRGGGPMGKPRKAVTRSWMLARVFYRLHGIRLDGRAEDAVWYFAFGANMHDSAFRARRAMRPLEWRAGRVRGYRLRFNLEGRPKGKAAPANISADPDAEVWGVLYRITRADLLHLDWTEGVPGRRYRHLWLEAEDIDGDPLSAVTYVAEGKEIDGNPSLRYITLLRQGARAHGLPEPWLRFLDGVKHAE